MAAPQHPLRVTLSNLALDEINDTAGVEAAREAAAAAKAAKKEGKSVGKRGPGRPAKDKK